MEAETDVAVRDWPVRADIEVRQRGRQYGSGDQAADVNDVHLPAFARVG